MALDCPGGPLDAAWRREWLPLSPDALRNRLERGSDSWGAGAARSAGAKTAGDVVDTHGKEGASPDGRWLLHAVRAYAARASPASVRTLALLAGRGVLTEDVQDAMAQAIAAEGPEDFWYREAVVRCLVACVVGCGGGVSDALAEALVVVDLDVGVGVGEGLEPWSSRAVSFWDASRAEISARYVIRQRAGLREVGLLPWAAGIRLAEYVLSTPEVTRGRRVLELGAGVGLTACCVAMGANMGRGKAEGSGPEAASLVATDVGHEVLLNLQQNLVRNGAGNDDDTPVCEDAGALVPPPVGSSISDRACPCFVAELEWHGWGDPGQRRLGPLLSQTDLILAADCMYDPEAVSDFVATLRRVLSASESKRKACRAMSRPPPMALVATTKRQETTLDLFLRSAAESGLVVVEIKDPWLACDHAVFDYAVPPLDDVVLLHCLTLQNK